MIIVKLIGGLGNQMFQYAAGRRLACFHNTDLFLDVTGFESESLRECELNHFRINAAIAPPDLLKQVPFSRKDSVCLGIRNFLSANTVWQYVREKTPDFHEEVLSLPDRVYLDGYWQSERYFAEISNLISNELSFVDPPSIINQELLMKIGNCNSVSVHIRRGDYVSNPETRRIHYVCDEKYYTKALTHVMKKVNDPEFFIFSDDPDWAQRHVAPNAPVTYISHNSGGQSYEDLRLMMHCRDHIIANSSFSWWGAWLSRCPQKIVIAPNRWFASTYNSDIENRIPKEWIILNE